MNVLYRLLIVAVLLVLLTSMLVHYGAVADQPGHDELQNSYRKLDAYDKHIGERVYFWSRVVSTTQDGLVVRVQRHRIRVIDTEVQANPGDSVQVAGVLKPNRFVSAEKVVVSSQTNLLYLYGVSALGGLLTATVFLRRWRIEWEELCLRPRRDRNA